MLVLKINAGGNENVKFSPRTSSLAIYYPERMKKVLIYMCLSVPARVEERERQKERSTKSDKNFKLEWKKSATSERRYQLNLVAISTYNYLILPPSQTSSRNSAAVGGILSSGKRRSWSDPRDALIA